MKFLIDVNLPKYIEAWKGEEYIHVADIDEYMKDSEIWEYAKQRNYCIVTKDSDFSNKMVVNEPPPRVVHIKTGNMSLKELSPFISSVWPDVLELLRSYKMISIFRDHIEGIK